MLASIPHNNPKTQIDFTLHHSNLLNHGLDLHFLYSLLLVPSILLVQFSLVEHALLDSTDFQRIYEENVERMIFEELKGVGESILTGRRHLPRRTHSLDWDSLLAVEEEGIHRHRYQS